MEDFIETYAKGLEVFGTKVQAIKCMEELGELISSIAKYMIDPSELNRMCIVDELADVTHTTNQMKLVHSTKAEQDQLEIEKIGKLVNKIQRHIDAGKAFTSLPFPYRLYFEEPTPVPTPAEVEFLYHNERRVMPSIEDQEQVQEDDQ